MIKRNRALKQPHVQEHTGPVPDPARDVLLSDVRTLIRETRSAVAVTINAGLTLLYWRIGTRIRQDILGGKRAGYGEQIVHALSAQLRLEFGDGFGKRNLFNMIRFAEVEVSNERGEGAAGAAGAAMSDRVLADRKPRLSVGTPNL